MDGSIDMYTSSKQYLLSVCFVPDFSEQIYLIQKRYEGNQESQAKVKNANHQ